MPKTGATPGKLLLIGGLAAVLGWLLFSPAESEVLNEAPELATAPPPRRPRPRPPATHVAAQKPAIPLAEVLRFDPFAPLATEVLGESVEVAVGAGSSVGDASQGADGRSTGHADPTTDSDPDDASEPPPDRLAGWRSLRVEAIIDTSRGKAALIGDRTVREGEVIDGVRVVKIASDGILVEDCAAGQPAD